MIENYNIGTLIEYEYGGNEKAIILNFEENIYKLITINQYKTFIRLFSKNFLNDNFIKTIDIKELTEKEISNIIYTLKKIQQNDKIIKSDIQKIKNICNILEKNYLINTISKSKSTNTEIQGEKIMEKYNYQLHLLTTDANTKIDELKNYINKINETVLELNKQNLKLKEKIENEKNELNIGNIQALKVFKNIKDFINKTKELYRVNNWHIQEGSYTDRANVLKNFSYYNTLKNEFNEKNLTNKPITDEQLVSFFDTISLMYKVLTQITDEKIKQEMKIIMEYVIPDPSKPRIDYMLIYRNSIFLLEFSKATSINTLSNESSKKLQQINGYATMLKTNINNNNIKINIAVGMYLDESSEENIETTSKTIDDIKKKINKTFKNEELKNAFEILTEME